MSNECHYRISGFKRGELCPSVTRLQFYVPGKETVMVPRHKVPNKEDLQKQIENHMYWNWFKRNEYESRIWDEHSDMVGQSRKKYHKLSMIMKEVNSQMGYDVLELVKCKKGGKTLQRVKDSLYGSKSENVPLSFELTCNFIIVRIQTHMF